MSATNSDRAGLMSSARTSATLLIVLTALALVLLVQLGWWIRHEFQRDDPSTGADAACGAAGTTRITVPDGTPVTMAEPAVRDAVQVAQDSATTIFTRSADTYDEDVAAAVATMTDCFAAEFGDTADAARVDFLGKQTEVEATVVGAAVSRADDTAAEVLLFVDQDVHQVVDGEPRTVSSQSPVLLTMASTDRGWLVAGVDAGDDS